jgi:hypothetical protein
VGRHRWAACVLCVAWQRRDRACQRRTMRCSMVQYTAVHCATPTFLERMKITNSSFSGSTGGVGGVCRHSRTYTHTQHDQQRCKSSRERAGDATGSRAAWPPSRMQAAPTAAQPGKGVQVGARVHGAAATAAATAAAALWTALTICCCICCVMRVLPPVLMRCLPLAYTCTHAARGAAKLGALHRAPPPACPPPLLLARGRRRRGKCATHLRPRRPPCLVRTTSCALPQLGCALAKAAFTARVPAKAEDLHCQQEGD